MLRLKSFKKKPEDIRLALPDAEPVTIVKINNESLPYACQCPLCGGIFDIPQGVLYRIEEDEFEDIDSGAEPIEPMGPGNSGSPRDFDNEFQTAVEGTTETSPMSGEMEGNEA